MVRQSTVFCYSCTTNMLKMSTLRQLIITNNLCYNITHNQWYSIKVHFHYSVKNMLVLIYSLCGFIFLKKRNYFNQRSTINNKSDNVYFMGDWCYKMMWGYRLLESTLVKTINIGNRYTNSLE